MFDLPVQIQDVLAAFTPAFSRPVWPHAQLLIVGAILARGKRTVSSALRTLGLAHERHFTNYHRVLNRAVWHGWLAAKILLGLLVALLTPGTPLVILVDETIERRKGKRIKTKGIYRDAVRSSRNKVVHCFGLRWVAMMLLVPVPWSHRPWALPFYTVQAPSEKTCRKLGKPYKSVISCVCFALRLIQRWHPERSVILVGDGAYAAIELAQFCRSTPNPITLVARFRWNAALYSPPPPPVPGKRGRRPKKGKRQPSFKQRLADPKTVWEKLSVTWYNGTIREVRAVSDTCLWYTPGKSPVPIRWVVIRDPQGELEDTPIICTDLDATPRQIIEWFVTRWNIEVTFEELRAHLGMETQRQWSERAIDRTTPCLFALFSLVTLMAMRIVRSGQLPTAQSAWYRKQQATFSDVIAFVRRHLWAARYCVDSMSQCQSTQFVTDLLNQLLDDLSEAA
jgi:DDE superfamily endonuclease